ncbi:MAG: hypothetical protein MMC33_004940 [Icmadophila ericetorum]|nr:hypothetical protein [Icmadophila ericetorum]
MAARNPTFPLPILNLFVVAHAYTTFESDCTIPGKKVNFVASSGTRGTLGILWSAAFTIFACTWTIQHLNVPEQRQGRDPGTVGDMKWKLKGLWTTAKWMLLTMVAPEVVLVKAYADFLNARKIITRMMEFVVADNVPWTLTHSLFANMGGFAIQYDRAVAGALPVTCLLPHKSDLSTKVDTTVQLEEGGIIDQEAASLNPTLGQERTQMKIKVAQPQKGAYPVLTHITATNMHELRRDGILARLPCVFENEINDKAQKRCIYESYHNGADLVEYCTNPRACREALSNITT